MTDHAKYRPGGIPPYIQCHPTPIAIAEVPEEVKGWQLFIERATPTRTGPRCGRTLLGTLRISSVWRQQIRDSKNSGICNCIVPYPLTPRNHALWTKMRILLYNLEGENSTLYGGDDGDVALLEPSASGPNPIALAGFLTWKYVETEGRYWPMFTQSVSERIKGIGNPAREIIEEFIFHIRRTYVPLNMEQPILDIFEDTKPAFDGGIDEWMNDIERYAPGYLDMEEENNGMLRMLTHGFEDMSIWSIHRKGLRIDRSLVSA
ncbi:hypothetical protein G7054_g10416 [Neopestalotiopsis clavispora]|nr:hypothetical protein G7054_g10416 [Neopestalotiopsis clavispora]